MRNALQEGEEQVTSARQHDFREKTGFFPWIRLTNTQAPLFLLFNWHFTSSKSFQWQLSSSFRQKNTSKLNVTSLPENISRRSLPPSSGNEISQTSDGFHAVQSRQSDEGCKPTYLSCILITGGGSSGSARGKGIYSPG